MSDSSNKKGAGRKVLLLLAVIFVLPFTVAATLHMLDLRPTGHSYGSLVNPPKNLKFTNLRTNNGAVIKPEQWLKKWSIVTVDNAGCQAPCQAQVQVIKQVHISLGKEYKRIQRILIVPADMDEANLTALKTKNPELKIIANSDLETAALAKQFALGGDSSGQIYLVDPLGNLMMSYNKDNDPKGLRSDLTRLLKNSWAG